MGMGEALRVQCGTCLTTVKADVAGSFTAYNADIGDAYQYSLLECPECSSPIVVSQWHTGDDWDSPSRIYPQRSKWLTPDVPKSVRGSFEEARLCLQAGAYTAAAAMCRRALEAICRDRAVSPKKSLIAALNELKNNGDIDPSLFEWADALRVTGNEAAHASGMTISRTDAQDTVDFTEAIIDYLYIFKARFEEFSVRRKKSRESAAKENAPEKKK
jgi:hypothetical protein